MGALAAIFKPIFYVLREKKKLLLLVLVAALFFAVLIFPYDDLSDLLMAQSAAHGVYLEFRSMGLSFFPPSLRLNKVSVDVAMLPTINAGEIYLAPSLMGLLTFSPGFSASVDNFLRGSLYVNYRLGHKIDHVRMQTIALSLDGLDLKDLSKFAQLPVTMEGRIQGDVAGSFDPTFTNQPSGSASIQINNLHIPAAMVPALMALTLPDMRISQVNLNSTLSGGQLDITDGVIGKPGDNVHGRIKGTMQLQINNQAGFVYTNVGPYQFNIDLTLDSSIEKNFGAMLSLLNFDQYRTMTADGTRYALKLSGTGSGSPPTPSPLDPNAF